MNTRPVLFPLVNRQSRVVRLHQRGVGMTLRARLCNVQRIHRRGKMYCRDDAMRIVACDTLCDAFLAVAQESSTNPDLVKSAPNNTARRRLDEAFAARNPVLKWTPEMPEGGEAFREFAQRLRQQGLPSEMKT